MHRDEGTVQRRPIQAPPMATRAAAPLKVKLEAALVLVEAGAPPLVGVPLPPLPLLTLGGAWPFPAPAAASL